MPLPPIPPIPPPIPPPYMPPIPPYPIFILNVITKWVLCVSKVQCCFCINVVLFISQITIDHLVLIVATPYWKHVTFERYDIQKKPIERIAFGVSFLHSYGITFIWDHIHMGSHSYVIAFIWDHIHMGSHSYRRRAYCICSVVSPFSHHNRLSTSLRLLYHVPLLLVGSLKL